MDYVPKGFVTLREAVILLAEQRFPLLDVRRYIDQPVPLPSSQSSLLGEAFPVDPKWALIFQSDPFHLPRTDWEEAEYKALTDAKTELLQALRDADLTFHYVDANGAPVPIATRFWVADEGFKALSHGWVANHLGQRVVGVCVREAPFRKWMTPRAKKRDRPSQTETDAWMIRYTEPRVGAHKVKRADAIQACARLTHATEAVAKEAWNKLPDEIRGGKGHRK